MPPRPWAVRSRLPDMTVCLDQTLCNLILENAISNAFKHRQAAAPALGESDDPSCFPLPSFNRVSTQACSSFCSTNFLQAAPPTIDPPPKLLFSPRRMPTPQCPKHPNHFHPLTIHTFVCLGGLINQGSNQYQPLGCPWEGFRSKNLRFFEASKRFVLLGRLSEVHVLYSGSPLCHFRYVLATLSS